MLKVVVDALESVPEAVRGFYEAKDGKFALKVEGLEDTTGLKSALAKEREVAKTAKEFQALGLSPAEIAELKASRDKAEEDKAKAAGDFETLRKRLSDTFDGEKKSLQDQIAALAESERKAVVSAGLLNAFAEAGVTAEGASLLPEIYGARAKIETVDGKRVVKITDADGLPMLAKSGKDATFADLAALAAEKYPSLFKATTKPGSGTQPGGNGAGRTATTGKAVSAADLEKMTPQQKYDFFKANPHTTVTQ